MKKRILVFALLVSYTCLNAQEIALELAASGFNSPVEIADVGDDRMFIVEKSGIIKIVENGTVLNTPFLDISNSVNSSANERGLLGLAFHPDYVNNQTFFVHYSNVSGNTTIAKFTANGNIANSNSETILLNVTQPYTNHNGGKICFGNDGYLYIGLGDGGSAGDPNNNSQNGNSLLGKLLRIDVDNALYSIPSDNPFVADASVANEVFAIGLRNPWKFSFDSSTQDIWIADVGQNAIEEINHSASASGLNYGWRCYEGNNAYNTSSCGPSSDYTFPVATYTHTNGRCSLTGGFVYRGTEYPNMQGKYFFADLCSNEIGMVDLDDNSLTWLGDYSIYISSFGEATDGTLYALSLYGGNLYKLTDTALGVEDFENQEHTVNFNNPVKERLYINASEEINQITILDITGKIIIDKKITGSVVELDVSNLAKEIYILQIQVKEGVKIYTKKLIKQ